MVPREENGPAAKGLRLIGNISGEAVAGTVQGNINRVRAAAQSPCRARSRYSDNNSGPRTVRGFGACHPGRTNCRYFDGNTPPLLRGLATIISAYGSAIQPIDHRGREIRHPYCGDRRGFRGVVARGPGSEYFCSLTAVAGETPRPHCRHGVFAGVFCVRSRCDQFCHRCIGRSKVTYQ